MFFMQIIYLKDLEDKKLQKHNWRKQPTKVIQKKILKMKINRIVLPGQSIWSSSGQF